MRKIIFIILGIFIFSGCHTVNITTENIPNNNQNKTAADSVKIGGAWTKVEDGLEKLEYYFQENTRAKIIIYKLTPDKFSFQFKHSEEALFLTDWDENLQHPLLLINGVYFLEDNAPAGMLIVENKKIGNNQFDPNKSGVIELAPTVKIIDTKKDKFDPNFVKEAAQAYPFLIKNSKPNIKEDSGQIARRTFIGTDQEDNFYLGILPEESQTLYELSLELSKVPVNWKNVINLDGGSSSGLIANTQKNPENLNSYVPIPNVLVVKRR